MSVNVERDEIREMLLKIADGGSLRYFYLHGGVALHDKSDRPTKEYCPIHIFLELKEKGLIDMTCREKIGYPHYANNHVSSEYRISESGKSCLPPK